MFDAIRIAVAIPLLVYASYSDIKTREVDNWIWLAMLALALPLLIFSNWKDLLLSVMIAFPFGYLMYLSGGYGAADTKAIWCLALLFPSAKNSTFILPFSHVFALSLITWVVIGSAIVTASEWIYGRFTGKKIKLQDIHLPAMPFILAGTALSFIF